jgi:hypothetical protein
MAHVIIIYKIPDEWKLTMVYLTRCRDDSHLATLHLQLVAALWPQACMLFFDHKCCFWDNMGSVMC